MWSVVRYILDGEFFSVFFPVKVFIRLDIILINFNHILFIIYYLQDWSNN